MKVLVTGCAGYVGSVLVPALLDDGHEVIGVDSLRYGNGSSLLGVLGEQNFRFFQQDVTRAGLLDHLIAEADAVIPLAALVGAPLCEKNSDEAVEVNYAAIRRLILNMSPNQRLIYPNTNSGYGETDGADEVTEESPMNPISVYGRTKCAAEFEVLSRPNSVSLRLATVFGASPRMRFDLMVNDFASRLWRGWWQYAQIPSFGTGPRDPLLTIYEGHFKRNFVHVRDVAQAFCYMLETDHTGAFNVGLPSANLTKLELAQKVCKTLGIPESLVALGDGTDPDRRNYLVSNAKLLGTGFRFQHSLGQGIKEVAAASVSLTPEDLRRARNA